MTHIASVKKYDIANGEGVRVSVFLSGCPHHCPGCFNQDLWDYQYGKEATSKQIGEINQALSASYINGLTLLGGEPCCPENIEMATLLCSIAKTQKKTVWVYSGYTYEQLLKMSYSSNEANGHYYRAMLSIIDVLVDGRFVKKEADKRLAFRGSANQRIIDMEKTRKQHQIVLWEETVK